MRASAVGDMHTSCAYSSSHSGCCSCHSRSRKSSQLPLCYVRCLRFALLCTFSHAACREAATWIYFAFVYDLYTSFQSIRLLGLMGQVVTTLRETFGLPHAVNQTLLRTPRAGQQRRLIRIWLLLNMFPVMAMLVLLVPSSLGLTGGRGILVCIYVCLV